MRHVNTHTHTYMQFIYPLILGISTFFFRILRRIIRLQFWTKLHNFK